jgi:hypothetical protein
MRLLISRKGIFNKEVCKFKEQRTFKGGTNYQWNYTNVLEVKNQGGCIVETCWADLEIKTKVMRRISCFMIILMLVKFERKGN